MYKIKDKQAYFNELNYRLENNFMYLFEDENFTLNSFLNNRLYSKREFDIFKKTFNLNYKEDKLRYIFEHSQQYSEIVDMSIQDYYVRLLKAELKYSGNINNLIKILANMPDKVTLDGYLEILRLC